MAGIIGIYGLVVSVLISGGLRQNVPLYTSFIQLGAGLAVGLAGLSAGQWIPFLPMYCAIWLIKFRFCNRYCW